jgi:hypothetical protein
MKMICGLLCVLALGTSTSSRAAGAAGGPPGPCKQIADACKSAGFIPGDWKKGDGLWKDCVDPIMQGQASAPGATKPLPTVDPNLVAQCKAKHPKYGAGKAGTPPAK